FIRAECQRIVSLTCDAPADALAARVPALPPPDQRRRLVHCALERVTIVFHDGGVRECGEERVRVVGNDLSETQAWRFERREPREHVRDAHVTASPCRSCAA